MGDSPAPGVRATAHVTSAVPLGVTEDPRKIALRLDVDAEAPGFLPGALRNFAITLAVIVPVTFLASGPVSDSVGLGLSNGINTMWDLSPAVGGALRGHCGRCSPSSASTGA